VLLEHATLPVHPQWSNAQPADGLGRFALAAKLTGQLDADWEFVKVFPQALIVPGDTVPTKLAGMVSNVTDSSSDCSKNVCAVEEEDV
jgi:hypothetical protein